MDLKMVLWYGPKLKCQHCGFIGLPAKGEVGNCPIPNETVPEPRQSKYFGFNLHIYIGNLKYDHLKLETFEIQTF